MNKLIYPLVVFCFVGILGVLYYQWIYFPNKLKECNDIAVLFERARHYPIDDLEVTNQDIIAYMKNVVNCVAE